MNITPHAASLPIATVVNPATEGLRRDNNQREIITQVTPTTSAAAEKGVASDKERARHPNQQNEEFDFVSLKKQAEEAVTSISEQKSQQDGQHNENQNDQHPEAEHITSEHDHNEENVQQEQVDQKLIAELTARDKEVRAHERAHASTGGSLTSAPSYTFEVGPDGNKYAVGGEVSVDLSTVPGDPQATIIKMKKVHAAALAPVDPSGQDIKVAASATKKILEAQSELLAINSEKAKTNATTQTGKTTSTFDTTEANNSDNQNAFDVFMEETLAAQESVISGEISQLDSPDNSNTKQQSLEVIQRATRIESFYFSISQGYERPDNFQFELTA